MLQEMLTRRKLSLVPCVCEFVFLCAVLLFSCFLCVIVFFSFFFLHVFQAREEAGTPPGVEARKPRFRREW